MKLYIGIDLHFIMLPMPLTINGFTAEDNDNYYVVINSCISEENKKEAVKHELLHILKNDIDSEEPINIIE